MISGVIVLIRLHLLFGHFSVFLGIPGSVVWENCGVTSTHQCQRELPIPQRYLILYRRKLYITEKEEWVSQIWPVLEKSLEKVVPGQTSKHIIICGFYKPHQIFLREVLCPPWWLVYTILPVEVMYAKFSVSSVPLQTYTLQVYMYMYACKAVEWDMQRKSEFEFHNRLHIYVFYSQYIGCWALFSLFFSCTLLVRVLIVSGAHQFSECYWPHTVTFTFGHLPTMCQE